MTGVTYAYTQLSLARWIADLRIVWLVVAGVLKAIAGRIQATFIRALPLISIARSRVMSDRRWLSCSSRRPLRSALRPAPLVAVVWFGMLFVFLAGGLRGRRGGDDARGGPMASRLVDSFSAVALTSAAVLVRTGAGTAEMNVDEFA